MSGAVWMAISISHCRKYSRPSGTNSGNAIVSHLSEAQARPATSEKQNEMHIFEDSPS
jgi:hypothetical protein